MASNVGGLATEVPPPSQPNLVPSTTVPSDDIVRIVKRQRESESVSPRSRAAQLPNLLASPSKVARLSLATATRSAVPLTGAAALEDERRRRVHEHDGDSLPTSPNPAHSAIESLMSGIPPAMSRPTETTQLAPTANMEPAAKAATALSMAVGGAVGTDDYVRDEDSPPVDTNTAARSHVTDSPAAMEVDSSKDDQIHSHQIMSPDERPQPNSLSYPGSLQAAAATFAEPPARGMSFPMPGHVQSSPTSSGGKKHKCPYCSTEFTRHHNLKSHLLTHSQEKPFVCTACDMRFRRLHDLKRHGKLHTGEKPHICPKCDRKFARGDALARHSKGAGGCAGRRASMGSFADGDELDGTIGGDDSTMSGVAYDNVEDDELRRQSLPSMGVQHSSGDGYNAHSRTYPPAGPRPAASGLYPPNVNQNQIGTTSSSSVPDSMASNHTANTSVSSIPGGSGGAGMYSQVGMTESPKPLSPGAPGHDAANMARQRSPSMSQQYQQQQIGRRPSDLQSPHGGQTRPKLPGLSHPGFVAPSSGTYSHGRTPSGAQPAADSGNMFAQSDPSVWEYIRLLEDKIKTLSDKVVSLDQDVSVLKKQLDTREATSTA